MDGRIFRTAFGKAAATAPLLCTLILAACNGGGGGGGDGDSGSRSGPGGSASAPTYIVRGTISGLLGSGLVLQNNGGDNLVVAGTANSFQFTTALRDHVTYSVSVLTHPSAPSQTCSVTNGSGTISGGNVTDAHIQCTTNKYLIGGTVTGLTGSGLVLRLNGGVGLPITSSPNFTFSTPVESGVGYFVEVLTQPSSPAQTCTVGGGSGSSNNGSGTMGAANVTNIIVACLANTTNPTPRIVRANVSGLTGTGLILQLNGDTPYSVPDNGLYTLSNSLTDGTPYSVVVSTPPSSPAQTCTLAYASGVISGDVTVAVTCAVHVFTIGGGLTGLSGPGLQLQLNGGEILSVAAGSTSFTFNDPIADTSAYRVAVRAQPVSPSQTCTLTNETGTVIGADVTTIQVNCVTNSFPVSVTVNGLSGAGLVLQNNGGPELAVSANGSFAFSNSVLSGASYQVIVGTQPSSPSQTCTLTNGTGTVGNGSVTNVVVDCATNAYAVGGSVWGLSGTGLVLQLNGSTSLNVSGDGNFAFNAIADSSAYAVTVATHPTGLRQTCTVTNGTGTVAGAAVTNVAVSCSLVKWSGIKQFGSAADDVVNAVALDPTNGDVVVVGCYQGALTGNEKSNCDMPGGNARAYVRKYDRTGDFKWERSLGNASNNQANAVIVDTNGNIYVTGISQGTFDGQPGINGDDIFLTKYDPNGNRLWTGIYGTLGPDRGHALAFDRDGNLYLGGTVYTTSYDIYVAKFSAASTASLTTAPAAPASTEQARFSSVQVGTTQPNESVFQLVVNASGVYVSGTTAGSLNGNVNGDSGTGTADTFVMKLDPATLAEVWTRQIGTASYDRNGGVVVDMAGNVYVAGSTGGGLALPPGVTIPVLGINDLFVVKYDTNGTELWRKQLVSPGHDHVTDIAVVPGGGVYITGYTTGNFDGSSNRDSSTNTTDVFLVKYDGAGTKVWSRMVGTTTDDRPYAVTTDTGGEAFVAGYTLGALDGNTNVGGADMFIIKYDANGARQ